MYDGIPIVQNGTAKYGVRDSHGRLSDERLRELAAIEQVRAFEIKMSQGAKPGKGGLLPAAKITEEIAQIRGIPRDKDSLSPNRHPETGNMDELLDMVVHVRAVTGKPVGIKTAIGGWQFMHELAETVKRRGLAAAPDFLTIDGGEGGSGAAPQALADHMALSINEALPRVVDALIENGLRERIKVIASGKLVTPAKVAGNVVKPLHILAVPAERYGSSGYSILSSIRRPNRPTLTGGVQFHHS